MPSRPAAKPKRVPRWATVAQLKVDLARQFWRIPEVDQLTPIELLSFLSETLYTVATKAEKQAHREADA
jgi:hypothetical protein